MHISIALLPPPSSNRTIIFYPVRNHLSPMECEERRKISAILFELFVCTKKFNVEVFRFSLFFLPVFLVKFVLKKFK